MNNLIRPKEAADEFLKRLISYSYDGTIRSIIQLLKDGPVGRKKNQDEIALHQWYIDLDEHSKSNLLRVLEKALELSIFSYLVLLDNRAAGYPIDEQLSDYSIQVNTYSSLADMQNYSPSSSTRFNLSHSVNPDLEDLHDEFSYLLRERDNEL
jgi:hypothetical protein